MKQIVDFISGRLLVAGVLAAISFPIMPMKRWLPKEPPQERMLWEQDEWFTHNLVNEIVEWVRADPQWWSKFFCFVIMVQFLCDG